MTAQLAPTPVFKAFDNNGNPLANGQLFTYVAGTTTPQVTYVDSTQTTPNTNPIILNARGECNLWLDPTLTYKFVLTDSLGNQIWSVNGINGSLNPNSSIIPAVDNLYTLGNAQFAWANIYLGANNVPAFDVSSGNVGYYAQTAAEATAGIIPTSFFYPPGNMLRYGLVPNSSGAAGANTSTLQTLLNYNTAGPTGKFIFPNTTGTDTYYFNAPIAVRGFCFLDLNGCTLNYTATVAAGAPLANTGLFNFYNDFGIENGAIACVVNCASNTGSGCAIFVGGRDVAGPVTIFDSLLPAGKSLGRGYIRNINISMTNTGSVGSAGIGLLGGISNLLVENVTISCGASVAYGVLYEFGWATNDVTVANRQTSHAKNMVFRNLRVLNCGNQDSGNGAGIALGAAYNCVIDGLYVGTAPSAFIFYTSESFFYRPWAGVDDQGAKRNMTLRNIVGENITNVGLILAGASGAGSGYLAATLNALGHPADYAAETNLMTYSVDGFSIGGTGVGITVSGPCDIRNGLINVVQASGSLIIGDEAIPFRLNNVTVVNNSAGMGIRAFFTDAIWNPPRQKIGIIENCKVAGNNATGIQFSNTEAVLIRNCQIGFNTIWDVANETVQTTGIDVRIGSGNSVATCGGVTADNNYVTVPGGGTSYSIAGTAALTNNLRSPQGTITGSISGWAIDDVRQATGTQLGSAAAAVNVYNKLAGVKAYNTSTNKIFIAQGALTTSTWISADGATTVTPS